MSSYQNTTTWKKLLGNGTDYTGECDRLKVEFEKFRGNAALIAAEIATILPELTVHSISHIDALWEMADIILPSDYPLNPAECFVLGGAFLLHDLGMVVAAYPDRMQGVQREEIWKDTVAKLCKQKGLPYDFENPDTIDPDVQRAATEKALRLLHAKRARKLAQMPLYDSRGNIFYLIDDEVLRAAYGTVIGQIAESHWLYCEELPDRLAPTLGALSCFPATWNVDPLKLACIVRIADAMHIDDRRAPSFLNAIRVKGPYPELHWAFQGKLNQPRIEHNRVVYTSKSPFGLQDIDAWWLCYDTLKMIDQELKNVDTLLQEHGKMPLQAIGVYGIDSLEQIQQTIAVVDWEPVDTSIRVNNVAKLVSTLGGMQLYGSNYLAPFRELVQNAADAIRARRCIDDENDDYGKIVLRIGQENGQEYIQVEDNGIGMSPNVLVNVLLDFGQSFWGSEQMHDEFPGLEQKPFQPTGKFGIGFFSVFMWGERVKVVSNRYDRGRDDTTVLEFVSGVNGRPILRKADRNEQIKNGGTCVTVWLSGKSASDIFTSRYNSSMNQREVIAKLCFALDCNLYLNQELLIQANDWQTISPEDFLCRLAGHAHIEKYIELKPELYHLLCSNLRLLKEEDSSVVGRACLYADSRQVNCTTIDGIVTVDGFKTTELSGIVGVLKGTTEKASRDTAIPIVSEGALDRWVAEQAQLLAAERYADKEQLEIAGFACTLSKKPTPLKFVQWKDRLVAYDQIVEIVKTQDYRSYMLVQDAAIYILERERKQNIELNENVFVCDMGIPGILQDGHIFNRNSLWPVGYFRDFTISTVEEQVVCAISEGWGVPCESVLANMQCSRDNTPLIAVIGHIEGEPVKERVDMVISPDA